MSVKIDLLQYRGNGSSLFTGRPQGVDVREKLGLDSKDKDDKKYCFVIPSGTTSFNPSFYLGLLFESIKRLGISAFEDKYSFSFSDNSPSITTVLKDNLEDGKRHAINTIEKKNGLSRFFK